MAQSALYRLAQIGRTRLALAGLLVAAIVLGLSFLAIDLVRQIEERSESRSDNAQWLLSQFELELLYLASVADAASHDKASLEDVRLRYDILFGRIKMLREGRVSELLAADPEMAKGFARVDHYIMQYLPLVDGPDEALRSNLVGMAQDGLALTRTAREMALAGVKISAEYSDRTRQEVARTLTLTGGLASALILFLLALLAMLLRLYRFNRERSAENFATLSRLNALVSTTMEALITVDALGRIQDVNVAALQVFGLSAPGADGMDLADLFVSDEAAAALFRKGQAPAVASQGRYRLTARHSDGRRFPVEISISRVTGMQPALFVVFLRDLSAQLRAEQALVTARDKALAGEKAKAELLAVMSHEIRTPLNGMIGTIELLDNTQLDADQREYLRILQASGRLLMHHVTDVLEISRLDSGVATPVLMPVDLVEIVREVIENQMPASRAQGNALRFDPPEGNGFVILSDGAQLRQVLLNLVGNAVKFTSNGEIEVDLSEDIAAGEVLIRVRDTGIGIAPEDMGRIFDDFVTLDASYARRASGTGLGLGIVRRIVSQMEGRLTVQSRLGEGSLFCITLPLRRLDDPQRLRPGEVAAPERGEGRALSVLLVEDNEFNRLIASEFLRQDGHRVMEAADGEAGIALAAQNRFDVILMDISMPRLDGVQATQAIRAGQGASRDTPVVAMTAHALAEDMARFRAGGMSSVLIKPITREALRNALRHTAAPPAAGPGEAGAAAVLDRGVLQALGQDLGQERARRLLARFRDELRGAGARIAEALGQTAPEETQRLVHRLTGSAAMFGAVALGRHLSEIEASWKAGAPLDRALMADRLKQVLDATEAALQDELPPQDSSLR